MVKSLVLIAHNLRSTHNVGSLLRTCEGLGIDKIYLTGYTPYPPVRNDSRLPHLVTKMAKQIDKTALGSQNYVDYEQNDSIEPVLARLKSDGCQLIALEQTEKSVPLDDFQPADKVALIVGREVGGIEDDVLALVDGHVEIPMAGRKESFNVAVAAAMALHQLKRSG